MNLALRHGKLPAYGRELVAMREAGEAPTDPVIVTDCWPLAIWFRNRVEWCALVCDPPEARFDLSPVHGLDVVAAHLDDTPPRWVEQLRAHAPRRLVIHEARAFARDLEPLLVGFLQSRAQ
jgi:hypothetical protein